MRCTDTAQHICRIPTTHGVWSGYTSTILSRRGAVSQAQCTATCVRCRGMYTDRRGIRASRRCDVGRADTHRTFPIRVYMLATLRRGGKVRPSWEPKRSLVFPCKWRLPATRRQTPPHGMRGSTKDLRHVPGRLTSDFGDTPYALEWRRMGGALGVAVCERCRSTKGAASIHAACLSL